MKVLIIIRIKKNEVTPTKKTKKKTVVIVGDSIVRNVPSRSLNQSLKEYFSVVKSFPGATTQDMKDYIKPTISRKPDMVILHTGTNDLKSNQNPSDIANEIVNLAKNIKNSGTEVSISALIPRGDRLSEKGRKVNKELQEKCTAENFAFILHKNINSKLDLFPDKLHPNKKGQSILKGNFRKFINQYVWCFSQGDNVVIQNNDIPLNTTRNIEDVSPSSPLTNSNGTEIKDPQSFLKDIRINNINRLIIGQLNINSLRNKFEQLSMINGNIDIFIISETKLDETFPAAQFSFQGFCDPY